MASARWRVGIAAGVEYQGVTIVGQQGATRLGGEALLPQILERGAEDPDHAGAAAGQRAGDRVGLVAEVIGDLADPLLGLLGDLDPAQCVRDRGR